MKVAHLTSVSREGHNVFRASCLCGWEWLSDSRLVREARKQAGDAAWDHWASHPVVSSFDKA